MDMRDVVCPLCLKTLPRSERTVTVSCPDCNKTWTPRQLAIGADSRARLIAEAVKPWREVVEAADKLAELVDPLLGEKIDIEDTVTDSISSESRALDSALCNFRKAAKSVKTNKETT